MQEMRDAGQIPRKHEKITIARWRVERGSRDDWTRRPRRMGAQEHVGAQSAHKVQEVQRGAAVVHARRCFVSTMASRRVEERPTCSRRATRGLGNERHEPRTKRETHAALGDGGGSDAIRGGSRGFGGRGTRGCAACVRESWVEGTCEGFEGFEGCDGRRDGPGWDEKFPFGT
jgi:hypothetical protein